MDLASSRRPSGPGGLETDENRGGDLFGSLPVGEAEWFGHLRKRNWEQGSAVQTRLDRVVHSSGDPKPSSTGHSSSHAAGFAVGGCSLSHHAAAPADRATCLTHIGFSWPSARCPQSRERRGVGKGKAKKNVPNSNDMASS